MAIDLDNEAEAYARSYAGTFPFMLDMKAKVVAGAMLSAKMEAAILRCQIADEIRAEDAFAAFVAKQSAPANLPMSLNLSPATEGFYSVDGTVFKVQKAVHGSGHLYAKRLVPAGDHGTWEYAPGAIKTLSAANLLTKEQAAEFGQLYGFCCMCGRTLTDETSIELGIGPICRDKI